MRKAATNSIEEIMLSESQVDYLLKNYEEIVLRKRFPSWYKQYQSLRMECLQKDASFRFLEPRLLSEIGAEVVKLVQKAEKSITWLSGTLNAKIFNDEKLGRIVRSKISEGIEINLFVSNKISTIQNKNALFNYLASETTGSVRIRVTDHRLPLHGTVVDNQRISFERPHTELSPYRFDYAASDCPISIEEIIDYAHKNSVDFEESKVEFSPVDNIA